MTIAVAVVIVAACATIPAVLWYRGWRSVIEHENANAVVHSLADRRHDEPRDAA